MNQIAEYRARFLAQLNEEEAQALERLTALCRRRVRLAGAAASCWNELCATHARIEELGRFRVRLEQTKM